jgi:hypothetical protein
VQFPASHVVPELFPFPHDVGVDVLVACIAADVLLGGLAITDDMLDGFIMLIEGVVILPFVMFSAVGHVPLYPGDLHVNGGFGGGHVMLSLVHTGFGVGTMSSHPFFDLTHVFTNAS